MTARAAGEFRRTPLEMSDQRVSWQRSDQAFFASGACHILAWACRDAFPGEIVGIAAMRFPDERHAFHVFATWGEWAFDHSGWSRAAELVAANSDFEQRAVETFEVDCSLADFCDRHRHRLPDQYWCDPVPRAAAYVERFTPPWG